MGKALLFSLLMAFMLSTAGYVGLAEAEVPLIVSLDDINGSGSPEVSVLKRETFNSQNFAYVMDGADGAQVSRAWLGDFYYNEHTSISQAVVPDTNGSGLPDIAMLGVRLSDGAVVVFIKDASTGDWIQTLGFDADFPPIAMAVVPDMDGNGISEIAVLGVRASDGKVMVLIKDASTNVWIPPLTFDANYPPSAMKVVEYASGTVGIAVLGVNPTNGNVKVVVRDVSTRNKIGNAIYFGSDYPPVDMAVVPDINGNSEPEIAVLGIRASDGNIKVLVRDAFSGDRVNAVFFDGSLSPVALEVVPDINGSGSPEIAVLGVNSTDSAVRVLVKDASSGGWIKTLGFDNNYTPVGMTVLPDMDGNGISEIAVLGVNPFNGKLEVIIKDASSDALINNIGIPGSMDVCDNSVPPVDVNSTVDGVLEVAGDYNYYRIEIPSSGLLAVYTTSEMNTSGYLKDSGCNTIATDSRSGDGSNFRINYSVDAGTYYVYVSSYYSGTGSYTLNVEFVIPTSFTDVTAIAGGFYHSVALKTDGTVWAWGHNSSGQLGNGTTTETCLALYGGDYSCSKTPLQAGSLTDVAAIAAGGYHSIALKTDGTVWAWGNNFNGQLGDGTTTSSNVPLHVCAEGETAPCSNFLTNVAAIAGGREHSMALKTDGTVWAWGYNYFGQLGATTTETCYYSYNPCSKTPLQVTGITDVVGIAGGGYHSMAVKADGTVWAWGSNMNGELGDGTTTSSNVPVQVCAEGETAPCSSWLTGVTAIAGEGDWYYGSHSMALKADGTVWAWGSNMNGELGDGATTDSNVPVQVCADGETAPCSSWLTGVTAISAGWWHSIAVKTDGSVWTWGTGYLGDGTTTSSSVPLQVCAEGETAPCSSFLTGVTGIAAGYLYSIAVKADSTVWAWGYNWYGQLGNGTTTTSYTPVPVINNPWLP